MRGYEERLLVHIFNIIKFRNKDKRNEAHKVFVKIAHDLTYYSNPST
jgi:hypothetical protein